MTFLALLVTPKYFKNKNKYLKNPFKQNVFDFSVDIRNLSLPKNLLYVSDQLVLSTCQLDRVCQLISLFLINNFESNNCNKVRYLENLYFQKISRYFFKCVRVYDCYKIIFKELKVAILFERYCV